MKQIDVSNCLGLRNYKKELLFTQKKFGESNLRPIIKIASISANETEFRQMEDLFDKEFPKRRFSKIY